MHCDRCNVDFSEGLRYCKWCGGPLADRPRVTGELHTCTSCSAVIQLGWAFCKSCGERLRPAVSEPERASCPQCGAPANTGALNCVRCGRDLTIEQAPPPSSDSADTSIISACSSCGERLDTGSLYCKGCGSAVYTEQTPFGGSSMLCGACNSHSPLGSRVCRVCGAPFVQDLGPVAESPAAVTPIQGKAATTSGGLGERYSETPPATPEQQPGDESDADTAIFRVAERGATGTVETNLLPVPASSRSEQQTPTGIMHMGRITGPVDEQADAPGTPSISSGELSHSSSTGTGIEGTVILGNEAAVGSSEEAQRPTTAGFGSDTGDSTLGSENKTAIFVSPSGETPPPAPRELVTREQMGTRQFIPPSPELEPTREFQPVANTPTREQVPITGLMAPAPQWTGPAPVEPVPTVGLSQTEWQQQLHPQVPPPAVAKTRTGLVISVVVGVLILFGAVAAVAWILLGRTRPGPRIAPPVVEQPAAPEQPIKPVEKPSAPVAPPGMVAVTAGTYTIGRDDTDAHPADPLEKPEHKLDMLAFFIDRTEVTNAAYKTFVDATGHTAPTNWTGTSFPEGRDDFPVTGVTWQDAADYALWAGKRLPTEGEWEVAARGTDGRIYPWGNDFRASFANIGSKPDDINADQYPKGMKAVGMFPQGASPAGAVDMIGNAWEWVANEIMLYAGNPEPKPKLAPGITYRVIRGGAYDGNESHDATYRGFLDASQAYPKVGFRCAKDAK